MNSNQLENNQILESFFNETEEIYEEIYEMIGSIVAGSSREILSSVLGPIHTIKGASGFLSELSEVNSYTHKLEDSLLIYREVNTPLSEEDAIDIHELIEGLFMLIDVCKNAPAERDTVKAELSLETNEETILENDTEHLKYLNFVDDVYEDNFFHLKKEKQYFHLISKLSRIHKEQQHEFFENIKNVLGSNGVLLFHLENIKSLGSQSWGLLYEASQKNEVVLLGMIPDGACQRTYKAFAFEGHIASYKNEDEYYRAE